MKESIGIKLFRFVGLFILTILIFFPFYWILSSSFKPESELLSATPTFYPHSFTLEHYHRVFFESNYLNSMKNSLLVSGMSTLIGVLLSIITAYSFSDFKYRGKKTVVQSLLITSMFPGILLMIPLYVLMAKLSMLNTLWSLIIVYVTLYTPFGVFTLRNFFDALPASLKEAAYIDGASKMRVLFRVFLPLSLPGIATVASWIFILSWSEFVFGMILINDPAKRTVVVALSDWMGEYYLDWGALTAGSVLVILPVILFFAFMGRGFIKGLTAGAVKG